MADSTTGFEIYRFYLNLGPQHPSTHGVLRMVLGMYGEHVVNIDPVLGYGHRMHEKMAESRPWPMFLPNTARMDYACALPHNHCYVCLIERINHITVPERAEYIRVITSELNRIASHLLWLGAFLLDLGAFTPILYSFDDREQILDILEHVTGSRLTHCYFRVGGVSSDIDEKAVEMTQAFVRRMWQRFDIYDKLITKNIIFIRRTRKVGIILPEMASRYGATGPVLRASGVAYDIRRHEPYSVYPDFDFEVATAKKGDAFGRYMVRIEEMKQSLRIISQAVERLPSGPIRADVPKKITLPPGGASFSVEGARGDVTYYLAGDGTEVPYRLKVRSPTLSNLSLIAELGEGMLLADLIAALGSLDLVIPEIDR